MSIEQRIEGFKNISYHPKRVLDTYKAEGKKVIGMMPYYVPRELVYAAGMVPMGLWGNNTKTISRAKEYCATFYCSLCQLGVEMLLDGTLDDIDGIITPTMCDTLRPMSQNIKVAVKDKIPAIFLAHPQNRKGQAGKIFCRHQYTMVKTELEKIAGAEITDEALENAICVYNRMRAAQRQFVVLAGKHPEAISAVNRSAVLKAGWFADPVKYAEDLEALNDELTELPKSEWKGVRVVTSGIICDNPNLLSIFDQNRICIAADDVAHESRSFRTDAPEGTGDPMGALCDQWSDTDCDPILYDDAPGEHVRTKHLIRMIRRSKAQGFVLFMMQFCDPEETDYPYLKKDLEIAGIPHVKLGLDQQMRDFAQANTSLQAFADVLKNSVY